MIANALALALVQYGYSYKQNCKVEINIPANFVIEKTYLPRS